MTMDLKFYFSLFLRRAHYFVLTLVVFSVLGAIIARSLPTVFETEAVLVVESEQIPGQLAASTVQTEANEQLQIIQQRILSRNILIEMSNRLGIYAERRANGERQLTADEIVADLRERIRIQISGVSARGAAQATIVTVRFSAPNGQLAASVTNEIVTLILQEDVSMRTGVARQTLEFFEQEVDNLDRELSEASAAILAFKEQNIETLPDSLEFRRTQQASAQERLLILERQIAALVDQRGRVQRLSEIVGASGGLVPTADQTPEQEQLRTLKSQRQQLLAVLSPENPRVKIIEQQIAPLEEIVAAQIASDVVSEDGEVLSPYEVELQNLDGQINFLEDQKQSVEENIVRLAASIEATPGNAIALEALERDFAAVQTQYNEAVAARAKAETGDTIEALSKGRRISVIEQAVVPADPTSPNRPLIAAAGVAGGALVGVALTLLLELLKPGIRRPQDLTKGLGITPFATLPYMRTRSEILRRRAYVWSGLVLILGLFLGGLWVINTFYMPLDLVLEQIQRRLR